MKTLRLILSGIFLSGLWTCRSTSALTTYYMDSLCSYYNRATLKVGSTSSGLSSSGILKATSGYSYQSNFRCFLTLEPDDGEGILVAIKKIDVRFGCIDKLTVAQAIYTYIANSKETYCSDYSDFQELRTFRSTGKLSIEFNTSYSSTTTYSGFELTFTAIRSAIYCASYEFECDNGRCISDTLKCDGHNHCGDRSEQVYCGAMSTGGKVGTTFVSIFIAIAVIAGIVYYRRKKTHIVTSTTHPPPQQQIVTSYPVQVSIPQGNYPPPPQGNYPLPPPQGNYPPPPPQGNYPPPPPQGNYPPPPPQGNYPPPPEENYPPPYEK